MKSSAFLLSFLTVSCEEFYILACSLFTLGRCGKTLYCSAGILRPQGFSLFSYVGTGAIYFGALVVVNDTSLIVFGVLVLGVS